MIFFDLYVQGKNQKKMYENLSVQIKKLLVPIKNKRSSSHNEKSGCVLRGAYCLLIQHGQLL